MSAEEAADSTWRNASTALVAYCVVLSLVSNGVFGSAIGDVSCSYQQRFSPSEPAFIIWLPIYILAGCLVFEQLWVGQLAGEKQDQLLILRNACYSISWLCAAGWTPAFTAGTGLGLLTAAVFLCLTAGFALAAVVLGFAEDRWSWALWVTEAAYSLLAGWTAVAAAINVAIAYQANQADQGKLKVSCPREPDDYNIFSAIDAKHETVLPLVLASAFAVAAASLPQPVLGVPIAWSIYWMRPSYYNYAAFAVITSGILAATARTWFSELGKNETTA